MAGFRFDDVECERLSLDELTSFVLYAPPGTAVFHQVHQGWTIGDHIAASQLDRLNWLQWAKTEDGQKGMNRPEPVPRPGMTESLESEDGSQAITVEDYLRMVAEAAAAEEEG